MELKFGVGSYIWFTLTQVTFPLNFLIIQLEYMLSKACLSNGLKNNGK